MSNTHISLHDVESIFKEETDWGTYKSITIKYITKDGSTHEVVAFTDVDTKIRGGESWKR